MNSHLNLKKCVQKGLKKCDYSIYMIYVQSMDLNKLGQMLGLGNMDFLVEDAIFLSEKAKDFLRSRSGFDGDPMLNLIVRCVGEKHLHVRDFMQLLFRDYCVRIVFYNNNGIEGRWLFFGEDSDDSRMWCLESTFSMEKDNLIKHSSEVYGFIDRVRNEIREIHTDLYYTIPWI